MAKQTAKAPAMKREDPYPWRRNRKRAHFNAKVSIEMLMDRFRDLEVHVEWVGLWLRTSTDLARADGNTSKPESTRS